MSRADPAKVKLAIERLKARAARAAVDPATFLEFVFKKEGTNERLRTAAHQRVMMGFVQAHPRCVVRGFPGCSKTYCLAALKAMRLGQNSATRHAIVSAARSQAEKPLGLVAAAIANEGEAFPELRAVFPMLRKSSVRRDKWSQTAITVARRPGIRDPSMVAFGFGGKQLGARLTEVDIDDILNEENTATPEQRAKINHWVLNTLVTRRGVDDLKITVWNVPWDDGSGGDPPDLTYALEKAEWPTLTIPIDGEIRVTNTTWTSPDLRESERKPNTYRLTAHDSEAYGAPLCEVLRDGTHRLITDASPPAVGARVEYFDVDDTVYTWPEYFGPVRDQDIKDSLKAYPDVYWSSYRMQPRKKAGREERKAWFERAKSYGVSLGHHHLVSRYTGSNPTFTGYDLAFGMGNENDYSCLFTFEVVPSLLVPTQAGWVTIRNARKILNIQFGRWGSKKKAELAVAEAQAMRSILRVETNGAQVALKEWIQDLDASLPVQAHHTGEEKRHRLYGVDSVFFELENGAWVIPAMPNGDVDEPVQKWIDECLSYDPDKHTGDVLIASWLARSQARASLGSAFAPDIRGILNRLRAA